MSILECIFIEIFFNRLLGADGVSTLPASTFGYNIGNPPDILSGAGDQISGTNEPPYVMDNTLADLVDANGDGLPDILKTDADGGSHTIYINQGQTNVGGQQFIKWSSGVTMQGNPLAQVYNLSDASVHLADMDGDGLADLVVRSAYDDVFYFPNLGSNAWSARQPMSIADIPPPAPFGETNVRTADFDFDKRIDIIQSDGFQYQIWLNLGNGQYFNRITVPQTNGFDFALPQVQIADFNGDRVPDVAWVRTTEVIVTPGYGYGNFGPPIHVPVPDFPGGGSRYLTSDLMARAKLTDINGDGLADLVIDRAPGNELWYWINQGNYTFSGPKVVTGMPSTISATAVVRWADINGNGTTDLIYADSQSTPRLVAIDAGELINGGSPPNALMTISNGLGRVTLIGYQSSCSFAVADAAGGQPWPDPVPFPVNVVTAVTNLDSLGHQYVTRFAYHNGYYDSGEHQFRGFGRVEQTDLGDTTAPTLVTRSFFDTGRTYQAMKGNLLSLTTQQTDGSVFWTETNSWTIPPVTLYTGTNGTNVSYAHPTANVKVISELGQGAPVQLQSVFTYDNFGNETTNADYGVVVNGDPTAGQDERIVTTVYALNTNAWIMRHPARQEISGLTNGVLSRVESYYDDETFSGTNFGLVTVGNLTLRQEWTNASIPAAYILSARTKYDAYGNPIALIDPLGSAVGDAVNFAQGHGRELAYDADFHTYPTTETIHVGNGSQDLVFQASYDEGFGTVSAAYDFNTNQTTFGYDTFARLISIVKPYDTTNYPTLAYNYALGVPTSSSGLVSYVESLQLDTATNAPGDFRSHYIISRQFVDGMGRKLMTKSEAEPAPGLTIPRVVISGATLFDAREKPSVMLNPCFSLNGGSTLDQLLAFESIEAPGWQGSFELYSNLISLSLSNAHQISLTYDATLREIAITNQDGTFRVTKYEPLLTRSFDENQTDPTSQYFGNSMVHYSDGLGRLVRVDEVTHLNNDGTEGGALNTWTTTYQYDLNDQLTRITDSQGNVKLMTYDGLKRKTFMNDPDRGVMSYAYDDVGNILQTTDAKNQLITYTYDGVNRILTEDYHDEGQPFSANKTYVPSSPLSPSNRADVVYFYDVPVANLDQGDNTVATARNTRGTLAYVWDLSGEEHTSYDARGRIEYTVKRIPDPIFYPTLQGPNAPANPQLVSYKTAYAYDSMDRMVTLVYPDNDEVTYQYNQRGLLQQIPGGPNGTIISNLIYHPSGQEAIIDYGNGVRTSYEHDNRLRLAHLFTFRNFVSTNDPQLINFNYDFDGVSNIRQITDNRPGTAVPAGDPRRNTQIFQYDDLYRITAAQYSFSLPGQPIADNGHIAYRYDHIGNMLAQTSTIADTDPLTGLPVANLGTMLSGGTAGTASRTGRAATDPPGPHALTSIYQPSTNNYPLRQYPYDANGNMLNLDGLQCTWDFKDRLVAAESSPMRAEYSYDFTDRRISKNVTYKPGSANFTNHDARITTLYINKYFEVREHDAPTKYVWNGEIRVAQVIRSLSSNIRVQRLRVHPGWNLMSLAVTATHMLSQLPTTTPQTLLKAYKWDSVANTWLSVATEEDVAEGTVFMLYVATNANAALKGPYIDPGNVALLHSGTFSPSFGLEAWSLSNALCSAKIGWKYSSVFEAWQIWLPPPIQVESDLCPFLSPGEAIFVRFNGSSSPEVTNPAARLVYIHQDHLGSLSSDTDNNGQLIGDEAYYPFGTIRNAFEPCGEFANYGFSEKEEDKESSLKYFELRLLSSEISRFLSVDPLSQNVAQTDASGSQQLNGYSYCANRPLNYTDPSGGKGLPQNWAERNKVAAILHEAANEGLSANVGSLSVGPGDFRRVANAILSGEIKLQVGTPAELGFSGKVHAQYDMNKDTLYLIKGWDKHGVVESSFVIHEATHAALDVRKEQNYLGLDEEALAYASQGSFVRIYASKLTKVERTMSLSDTFAAGVKFAVGYFTRSQAQSSGSPTGGGHVPDVPALLQNLKIAISSSPTYSASAQAARMAATLSGNGLTANRTPYHGGSGSTP